eukprot:5887049-Amphidinium_carterae.1
MSDPGRLRCKDLTESKLRGLNFGDKSGGWKIPKVTGLAILGFGEQATLLLQTDSRFQERRFQEQINAGVASPGMKVAMCYSLLFVWPVAAW